MACSRSAPAPPSRASMTWRGALPGTKARDADSPRQPPQRLERGPVHLHRVDLHGEADPVPSTGAAVARIGNHHCTGRLGLHRPVAAGARPAIRVPDGPRRYGLPRANACPRPRAAHRGGAIVANYEGYCVKCREKRQFDGQEVELANGRRAAQGACPICGTKMNRILGKKQ